MSTFRRQTIWQGVVLMAVIVGCSRVHAEQPKEFDVKLLSTRYLNLGETEAVKILLISGVGADPVDRHAAQVSGIDLRLCLSSALVVVKGKADSLEGNKILFQSLIPRVFLMPPQDLSADIAFGKNGPNAFIVVSNSRAPEATFSIYSVELNPAGEISIFPQGFIGYLSSKVKPDVKPLSMLEKNFSDKHGSGVKSIRVAVDSSHLTILAERDIVAPTTIFRFSLKSSKWKEMDVPGED